MNPDPAGSVEEQLRVLRLRVSQLEAALGRHGIAVTPMQPETPVAQESKAPPAVSAAPVQPIARAGAPPLPPPPPLPPIFQHSARPTPVDARSLESRIGSQWFNRIGILALLIGVAWFLKFAFDSHWIGALGRVLIGLVAGAGLIAWSERFRSHGYAAFSYSLKAAGSGILYLSLWAAFSYFHLISGGAAFAAMILVTAFNGYMAWAQDAELLALYAIAGGLSTPLLVSTGGNHEVALLSYLLLLDAAVLILVALRPWSRLLFMSFAGTVVFMTGWWVEFYSPGQAGRTAFFVACFFFLFAFAPRLIRLTLGDDALQYSRWHVLALFLMPLANSALGFLAFYNLFDSETADWAGPWLAVAFAAFYLGMLRIPERSIVRRSPALLSHLHLTVAVVFLTIAIPLKAHGRWLTIGWLVEGAAMLWIASRLRAPLLRVLALLCIVLGLGALLVVDLEPAPTPIFNGRFATYCVAIAVCAFSAWLARKSIDEKGKESASSSTAIAAISVIAVNLLILIAFCLEIHSYWSTIRPHGNWGYWYNYRVYEQFSYSAFLMLFGMALLALGFWRRSAFLRWQALVLLAVTIAKVFLADMSGLSQGYRILSFLGLGVLLLAVSFIYQRDWLNLRAAPQQPGPGQPVTDREAQ